VSIYRDGTKRTQPLSTAKAAIVAAGQLSKARARLTGTPAWNPWPSQRTRPPARLTGSDDH
jgi:hypothetical protein